MTSRREFLQGATVATTAAAVASSDAGQVAAAEWPQWRGPERTGISREQGLMKQWPQGGPTLLWKAVGLGGGYSTPTVAGGRVYGMGYVGGNEVVWAVDAKSSNGLWMTPIATANNRVGYGDGSRSSPTVDGNRLYVVGVSGDLTCLDTDGKVQWKRNFVSEFGGSVPGWGYCESPLVDGAIVVGTPGGRSAVMAGFNKQTGQTVWQAQAPQQLPAHYASPIAANLDGQRQYVNFTGGGVVGVSTQGRVLWTNSFGSGNTANCPTPIASGNFVFVAAGYGKGGVLLQIQGGQANQVYHTPAMVNHHGGIILLGEHVYGFSDGGGLTCLNLRSGQVAWSDRSTGKCSLSFADGMLYARAENRGTMTLVEANPQAFAARGRFEPPERSSKNTWPHPVVADGRLFLRDQDVLHCYAIRSS